MRAVLVLGVLFLGSTSLLGSIGLGEEKKVEKRPVIVVASPLAVAPGESVKLSLRGLFLDEITEVTLMPPDVKPDLASKGKGAVPPNYEASRIGDTQAEIRFQLPLDLAAGPLKLTAVSAAGLSEPYQIAVIPAADLIQEKEPNDGFQGAQSIPLGKTVTGTIHDARNVDVFEFKGEAGRRVEFRIQAARLGSPLDPILTVYDSKFQVLAGADDTEGRDPKLEFVLGSSESCYLSIQDASDSGGIHFAYLLSVTPLPQK